MNTPQEQNQLIRKEMRAKRLAFSKDTAAYTKASLFCQEHCLSSNLWKNATHIALYAPFRGETDTLLLAQKAYEEEKIVCYPKCCPETKKMDFIPISFPELSTSFAQGAYGISEPMAHIQPANLPKSTLVIAPCLAFDQACYRLGYGGGFYDRFLSATGFSSMILAFSFQESSFYHFDHDIQNLAVATDKELICSHL